VEARVDNLGILYQGALTAAVRIQARRQQIGSAAAFRQRMKDVLAEVGREALRRNYTAAHIGETDFAFVAFLDEVILSSDDPCRHDWAQKPLQEDLFGVSTAGEQFFTRLDNLLSKPDTAELADVLEVYYLCLLLGFQGRYILDGRANLQLYSDRLRQRIERLRGARAETSADQIPSEVAIARRADPLFARLRITALCMVAFAALCFLIFSVDLLMKAAKVNDVLLRSLVP
jgi:type VI secretion system protein ImpK